MKKTQKLLTYSKLKLYFNKFTFVFNLVTNNNTTNNFSNSKLSNFNFSQNSNIKINGDFKQTFKSNFKNENKNCEVDSDKSAIPQTTKSPATDLHIFNFLKHVKYFPYLPYITIFSVSRVAINTIFSQNKHVFKKSYVKNCK